MSAEKDYTKKYTGVMGVTLLDLESSIVRAIRLPTNVVIDDNPEVEEITGTDSLGRETVIDINVQGFKPTLTLSYSGSNTDLFALQKGRKVKSGTFDLELPKEMQVLKPLYAGAPTGKIGFGVTADIPSFGGTVSDTGELIELTQQPFAAFVPGTPNSFAIGANFARKFSDDLVTGRRFVQLQTAQSITARTISEDSLGPQRVNLLVKNSNDTVTYVKIYNAVVNPSGSRFDPKADSFDLKFNLTGLGQCEPYTVFDSAETVYCEA